MTRLTKKQRMKADTSSRATLPSLKFEHWSEVINRIEFCEAPIPSCEARRLLRTSIEQNFVNSYHDTYDHLVAALDQHPQRSMILAEIIAIWFLAECDGELEARGKDFARRFNGTV